MSVHAYHPETGADVVVTDEALAHMRVSGWMLRSEYEEQQAAQAAASAAAAKGPAAKSAKSAEEK